MIRYSLGLIMIRDVFRLAKENALPSSLLMRWMSLPLLSFHKTSFRTHHGYYEYLVMPSGMCNAHSTSQAAMNTVFRPYLRSFILVFFDDILVYSRTWEDHLVHLRKTMQVLADN